MRKFFCLLLLLVFQFDFCGEICQALIEEMAVRCECTQQLPDEDPTQEVDHENYIAKRLGSERSFAKVFLGRSEIRYEVTDEDSFSCFYPVLSESVITGVSPHDFYCLYLI